MKNCVVFNDLSGYGNCSLMAAIPVLTVMGVRVHPVPTAVLTRQTGYDRYSMEDLTGFMPQFTADWQGVQPDGIITGFLSNPAQGDCIADFLAVHRTADTLLAKIANRLEAELPCFRSLIEEFRNLHKNPLGSYFLVGIKIQSSMRSGSRSREEVENNLAFFYSSKLHAALNQGRRLGRIENI